MNLSHAAAVLFYELSQVKDGSLDLARRETLLLLLEKSRKLLQEASYPEHKLEFTVLMLRRIFGRAELTEREARTLLGVIKNLRWKASVPEENSLESSLKQDTEI